MLSSYLQRFNKDVLLTKDYTNTFYIEAFHNSLLDGEHLDKLTIREPKNIQELLTLADTWIKVEKLKSSR